MHHAILTGILLALAGMSLLFLSACGKLAEHKKIKDLDYTVCEESRLPAEVRALIAERKEKPFRFTYTTNGYTYIVVGYGAQGRDALSVTLQELYLGDDAIYIETSLVSDSQELCEDVVTYPYIAVKCERYELPVIYLGTR